MNLIMFMASCYECCYHLVMCSQRYAVCVRLSVRGNKLAVTMVTHTAASLLYNDVSKAVLHFIGHLWSICHW